MTDSQRKPSTPATGHPYRPLFVEVGIAPRGFPAPRAARLDTLSFVLKRFYKASDD